MSTQKTSPGFRRRIAGLAPFGWGAVKPHHFRDMLGIAWKNRDALPWAWKVLSRGVCDGCALGTSGLRDWTIEGTHLCMVRLELLRLNTMGALDVGRLRDVASLSALSSKELRELGRLPVPLRRRRGEAGFTPVSWPELLADAGARWRAFDPARTAMYVTSRGITNETYFAAQKAMRFLGSANVDNSARLCHSPSTAAMKDTLGVAASTCSYKDWYSTDALVFLGSNPANDQPVAMKYLIAARRRGARVLVVNAYREPGMEKYWVPSDAESAVFGSKIADRFWLVRVGGDLALLNAVAKRLLERGAGNTDFVAAHTSGLQAWRAELERQPLDALLAICGLPLADIDALADELQRAGRGVLVWSMGITQHAHGGDTVRAIANLGLLLGWVGREGAGLMPIRGHSGVQGGAEMGAYATALPGGLAVNEANAARFSELWGFPVPSRPGLMTTEWLDAAWRGELQGLYCIGGNFLETLPAPGRVAEALGRIPLRLHSDIVLSSQMLVEPADTVYLLPARTRYEQQGGGTETTTERRVIFSPHLAGHEIGETREEFRMLADFARAVRPERAQRLGLQDSAAIRREIALAVPAYAGIEKLERQGDQFQWGGPRLCEGGQFPTSDGRGHFLPVRPPQLERAPVRGAPAAGRFLLATRRGKQFNSMVQRERDPLTGADRDHVFLAHADAARLGLRQDDRVLLRSPQGEFRGRVFLADVAPGTLQGHWPEVNVLLATGVIEPDGGVPDYNAEVELLRELVSGGEVRDGEVVA